MSDMPRASFDMVANGVAGGVADGVGERAGREDRLPIPVAAAFVIAASLSLWVVIGFGLRWAIG